jgi:hypothetical protein
MRQAIRKPWFCLFIGLSFGLIILLANREWMNEFILKPLFYEWLLLQIYLGSIPGLLLWVVFLVLAAISLAIVLLNLFKQKIRFEPFKLEHPKEPLRNLAEKIQLAQSGHLFRRSLNRELGEIIVALIAAREHVDIGKARRRFDAGTWTNNEEIKELLVPNAFLPTEGRLRRLFSRWLPARASLSEQAEIEKIVAYLEDLGQGGSRAIG